MPFAKAHKLKKYPFVRLLAALVAGIILQWYLQLQVIVLLISAATCIIILILFFFFPFEKRFSFRWLQGLFILLLFALSGSVITYTNDIRHKTGWVDNYYKPGDSIIITLEEPLTEKNNSYKALASVNAITQSGGWKNTAGKILVYFKKDSLPPELGYGSKLLLHKLLQPITNSGNPGAFDYNRYCLFQDITAQVFLKENDYMVLPGENTNWLWQKLFAIRNSTIKTLQQYIPGEKEQGVAEALLIGYRDDLDKELVQAYSNTGVVHIIAISGLHLGMIYTLMLAVFSYFKRLRFIKWIQPIIILLVLWTFTMIAGAVPSILRSAVMFTFIVFGEMAGRKTNIYNTLAASAFCLLVLNPFMLWDVGFLLSYAAVASIAMFMKPVKNWFYIKNKWLDKIWSLTSVTIAAQIFTIPIVVFYFHQFPNFFLVTNFIAVPLSGLILYGEILLLIISFIGGLAKFIGLILGFLITAMNVFIEYINSLSFAVWNNLQITVLQTWMLYGCIAAACIWLMQKSPKAFVISLSFLTCFTALIIKDLLQRNNQQKLIVYNVPKQTAIDILQGSSYQFTGDSILLQDGFLRNFHLKPSRTLYHVTPNVNTAVIDNNIIQINHTSILLLNNNFQLQPTENKIPVDIIIISGNPKIYISQLQQAFTFKQLIFDSSNPLWKTGLWKKDCDSLHLRFHSVAQQGAFVMDL
ncbi:MAG TPA: ComEC/Rec2 family competence protein [Panacibacter sp.]|nr:ComEC/Rec2 family competence protein [Panacibacter sp.]